jgi:hypothetical protein
MDRLDSILSAVAKGNSVRATSRMTVASKVTILRVLEKIGPACAEYQDKVSRNQSCKRIQSDEIWQFCHAKDKKVPAEKRDTFGFGDVWTWVAIDADIMLVVSFALVTRGAQTAYMGIGLLLWV